MSSRKLRRSAVLVLVLSSGLGGMAPAAAARQAGRAAPIVQGGVSISHVFQNILSAWWGFGAPKSQPGPPGPPPGDPGPPPPTKPNEGSGMCPNGGGPRPGPGQ